MYVIGIDPDLKESGFCVWNTRTQNVNNFGIKSFFSLYSLLVSYKLADPNLRVVIEGGHLNKKGNFHGHAGQSKAVGERIAKNVGSNHAIGILLGEMCDFIRIPYTYVRPHTKKTLIKMFKMITGIEETNQDIIDAIMLVWGAKK